MIHGLSAGIVQTNQSNRLEVLSFHGTVLSVKVKGTTPFVQVVIAMVGAKKLNEMRVNLRRGVVNNISIVKTEGYCGLAGYLVDQETGSLICIT